MALSPRISLRSLLTVAIAALLFSSATTMTAPSALALPPGTPSKATAQAELNSLTVRSQESMTGYSRDKFPHWIGQGDNCNTREVVLERDADYASIGADCYPDSGRWYSYYDGAVWYQASDVDIDHIVPLAEAWRSGARNWTTSKRQNFANDLNGPQLIAVTDNVNQAKGDQDPSAWQPPRSGARCAYSKWWIHTKYRWGLHLQSSEKSALQNMLNTCSY